MTSPPGKFNICGGDCSLYLDCTDWVFPTDYKTCSTSLQFDENAQLCVAVSSTCPFVGVTGMQPSGSYQLAGMQPSGNNEFVLLQPGMITFAVEIINVCIGY